MRSPHLGEGGEEGGQDRVVSGVPEFAMRRIILDLCGGSGSWSEPYRRSGYDVRLVTLPDSDVREYRVPQGVWGVLAAPPCTEFALSGARWWRDKPGRLLDDALDVVVACLRIIDQAEPMWWALENPVGRLRKFIGPPVYAFDPCDFGDPWTKRTQLWGHFEEPVKNPVPSVGSFGHRLAPGPGRAALRAQTPIGFAEAFFEANP